MITEKPITTKDLIEDLSRLGLKPGMTLFVHSSLKSLGGWIVGGAESVVLALEEVLGADGTLVMPTQSPNLTDPSTWMNPPADPKWWQTIRDYMPPYSPDSTLTTGMGAIPEAFRKGEGVIRSNHPHVSFAAKGRNAQFITGSHPLSDSLGELSPLGRMYELETSVLMLGTTFATNTSFHLAEYRADWKGKQQKAAAAPVRRECGITVWESYNDINFDSDDFEEMGADFERDCPSAYNRGFINNSRCILAQQRPMVDYAVNWLEKNRRA